MTPTFDLAGINDVTPLDKNYVPPSEFNGQLKMRLIVIAQQPDEALSDSEMKNIFDLLFNYLQYFCAWNQTQCESSVSSRFVLMTHLCCLSHTQ